jgi:hypothetical protein
MTDAEWLRSLLSMPALYYSTPTILRIAARLEQLERENAVLLARSDAVKPPFDILDDCTSELAIKLVAAERENAELKEAVKERSRFSQCVYCGAVFDIGSVDNADEAAKAHIQQCEKHPIYKLKQEIAALKHPALGPNPTAREVMADFMRRHGYEGVYHERCSCPLDTFGSKFHCLTPNCRAGYIQPDGSVGPDKPKEDGNG